MRQVFRSEMDHLGERLVEMTGLVGAAMGSATHALLTADLRLAESVIAGDAQIDEVQRELDDRAVEILARQSPVATDLRTVVASLRMSSSLERMGDLARHVALLARMRYPRVAIPEQLVSTFDEMGAVAQGAAAKAGRVIVSRDLEVAAQIAADDSHLDALHRQVFVAMTTPEWTFPADVTADVTLASRFFERYGDHAVSLANRVVFLVTGELGTRTPNGEVTPVA